MTREEQLKFCKTCLNRGFDPRQGIICNLTNRKAEFDETCPSWNKDENALIEQANQNALSEKRKKKQTREKVPERITVNDIGILLAISLSVSFIFRFIIYARSIVLSLLGSYTDMPVGKPLLFFFLIVTASTSVALFLRESKMKDYRFFGDLKFKLMFAFITSFFQMSYLVIVYPGFPEIEKSLVTFSSHMFVATFAVFLSVLILKPFKFIQSINTEGQGL